MSIINSSAEGSTDVVREDEERDRRKTERWFENGSVLSMLLTDSDDLEALLPFAGACGEPPVVRGSVPRTTFDIAAGVLVGWECDTVAYA